MRLLTWVVAATTAMAVLAGCSTDSDSNPGNVPTTSKSAPTSSTQAPKNAPAWPKGLSGKQQKLNPLDPCKLVTDGLEKYLAHQWKKVYPSQQLDLDKQPGTYTLRKVGATEAVIRTCTLGRLVVITTRIDAKGSTRLRDKVLDTEKESQIGSIDLPFHADQGFWIGLQLGRVNGIILCFSHTDGRLATVTIKVAKPVDRKLPESLMDHSKS